MHKSSAYHLDVAATAFIPVAIASAPLAFVNTMRWNGALIMGDWQLAPWWGLWMFLGSFVSSFVREKTGSITAPALLHAPPRAIASALFGM